MTTRALAALCLLALSGCTKDAGDQDTGEPDTVTDTDTDTGTDPDTDTDVPTQDGVPLHYAFWDDAGVSTVSYGGQIFRHLLIVEMRNYLGSLTSRLDNGTFFPVAGEVVGDLEFYFSFDSSTSGSVPLTVSTSPAPLQTVYDDVSTNKDLVGKLAGNDPGGQHKDWSTAFVGWPEEGVTSPESLVWHWFAAIDEAAVDRSNGVIPLGPTGEPLPAVFLDAQGRDYQQLLQKFLLGAVTFSQAADDYLDDDEPDKGLLADHSAPMPGQAYTALEHAWDEGFGYFGAARDYGAWSDDVISSPNYADTFQPDGAIDLLTEYSWGHSQNAGKRDRGAVTPTDFTWDAWEGFVMGRKLLAETEGPLSEAELNALRGWRDQALRAWEEAIAATVVHYINDTLRDMNAFGTDSYSFADHAKHWSEMKGFALSFQFNPHSPLSDGDFAALHDRLGVAPVLPTASVSEIDAYRDALLDAREILGAAYGFDAANLGDADGENGW